MITREEIAAALDNTVSNVAVARHLGIHSERVRRVRAKAGVPPYPRGGRRAAHATWAEAFAARTVAVRGGHLRWAGARSQHGTPVLHLRTQTQTAYRYAFQVEHGREPVGNVAPGCGYCGCVAGAHLEDRLLRQARCGRGAGT
ncbi:hypothetical protein ABZ820_12835 [Streptomyces diacarni]|uniref:hypothetical protein n=1 Tax=Streptomyces diacarni TaxID=2800381 RepID=UPI0033F0D65B